jgi:hypothetical protein
MEMIEHNRELLGLKFDPYNQFVFWREENALKGAAVGNARCQQKERTLETGSDQGQFAVLYESFSLLLPNRERNELLLVDVESGNVRSVLKIANDYLFHN